VIESGSKLSGNTYFNDGGVYVNGGTVTMIGGQISGNTTFYSSNARGGGVYVGSETFMMTGGKISGNTSSFYNSPHGYGGGVYIDSSGTLIKQSGGIIYGSNASDTVKNTAYNYSYGHAVYVSSGSKVRNSTAGSGVTMSSSVSGFSRRLGINAKHTRD
jgi:hypothetical protein